MTVLHEALPDGEPIVAYKIAGILGDFPPTGKLTFHAQSQQMVYGVEDVAKCVLGKDHRAPDEECTCGFYARAVPQIPHGGYVALEVELYGKVLVGQTGYRAEKQRVLSVTAARPTCHYFLAVTDGYGDCVTECSGDGAAVYATRKLVPVIPDVDWEGLSDPQSIVTSRYVPGMLLCAAHAVRSHDRYDPWEPAPVNCETDWRWYTPAPTMRRVDRLERP